MAVDSFELLARQTDAIGGELRVKLLQTLFDILILHGINFGENRDPNDGASFDVRCLALHVKPYPDDDFLQNRAVSY